MNNIIYHNIREQEKKKLEFWNNYLKDNGYTLISADYRGNGVIILSFSDSTGIIYSRKISRLKTIGLQNLTPKSNKPKTKNIIGDEYFEIIKNIAKSRGGKIISNGYKNSGTKIECEDIAGNHFWMSPECIKRGSWSPYEKNTCEHICRQIFEYIFNCKFIITNKIVVRQGKVNLQLDGYNDNVIINNKSYKIAFEYQGYYSHRTDQNAIERDNYKKEYCKNNNIVLFVIDEFSKHLLDDNWIFSYIKNMIVEQFPEININYDFKIRYDLINSNIIKYNYWKNKAEQDGFTLISETYINCGNKMIWKRNSDGYIFKRSIDNILQNGWPPNNNISKGKLLTKTELLNRIQNKCQQYGGKLLDTEWKGDRTKHKFLDVLGNEFESMPCNVFHKNSWSPYETNRYCTIHKENNMLYITTKNNTELCYDISNEKILKYVKYPTGEIKYFSC
jgi:hypothetical protein